MDTAIFLNSRVWSWEPPHAPPVPPTNLSFQIQLKSQKSMCPSLWSPHFSPQLPPVFTTFLRQNIGTWQCWFVSVTPLMFFPNYRIILTQHFKFRKLAEHTMIVFIIHCLHANVILNPSSCMSFICYSYTLGQEYLKIAHISPKFNNFKKLEYR